MDWPRVKTMLIGLLLLVNALLGLMLGYRIYQDRRFGAEADEALAGLLRAKNIEQGDTALPEQGSPGYDFTRSEPLETRSMDFALGLSQKRELGHSVTEYRGARGTAQLRMSGAVSVSWSPALNSSFTAQILRNMDVLHDDTLPERGFFPLTFRQHPVFSAGLRLVGTEDGYMGLEGTWLWGEALPLSDTQGYSAGTCLLSLADALALSEPHTLDEATLGYVMTVVRADIIRLMPYWKFVLSGQEYYVNATSGRMESISILPDA